MTQTTTHRSLTKVLSEFRFAMLVTADGTSRPLTLQEVDGSRTRFLVDTTAAWTAQVNGQPVNLSLADPGSSSFVSVTGRAELTSDRTLIERLYDAGADVFFDGPSDPRIGVLTVTAQQGEWWDSPHGRAGQVLAMVKAKVTGDRDDVGQQGTIDLT